MLIAVAIALSVATIGILVVLVISLARQVAALAGSLREFQEEVQPVLERIRTDAEQAQGRLQRLSERSLREAR